jgi:hypothetical protein
VFRWGKNVLFDEWLSWVLLGRNLTWSNWCAPLNLNHRLISDEPNQVIIVQGVFLNLQEEVRIVNYKVRLLLLTGQIDEVQVVVGCIGPLTFILATDLSQHLSPLISKAKATRCFKL